MVLGHQWHRANNYKQNTPRPSPPTTPFIVNFPNIHYCTQKPIANYNALNWGQEELTFQEMMGIWGICPHTFESDCSLHRVILLSQ